MEIYRLNIKRLKKQVMDKKRVDEYDIKKLLVEEGKKERRPVRRRGLANRNRPRPRRLTTRSR